MIVVGGGGLSWRAAVATAAIVAAGCAARRPRVAEAVLKSSGTPVGGVPSVVAALIHEQCAGCHGPSHRLNLHTLPAATDADRWMMIADAVESGRMPPPRRDNPFPIQPGARTAFTAAILEMTAGSLGMESELDKPVRMPINAWLEAARVVATPYMTEDDFAEIVRARRAGLGGFRTWEEDSNVLPRAASGFVLPLSYVSKRAISAAICERVVQVERSRAPAKSELFGDVPLGRELSGPEQHKVSASVRRLVLRRASSDAEVARSARGLSKLYAATGDVPTAVTALCATLLSGPELEFIPGIGNGER